MGKPVLEWVEYQDELHHVSDFSHLTVENRPDVFCPECHEKVTLKLGKQRVHHVAHPPYSQCRATQPETVLHINSKLHVQNQLLTQSHLFYQQRCVGWEDWHKETQHSILCEGKCEVSIAENWDTVRVEYPVGPYIADVALLCAGAVILVIEIKVSHAMDDPKKTYLKEHRIPWVEISVKTEEFYLGKKSWQGNKPLSIDHGALPSWERWTCPPCKEQIQQREKRTKSYHLGSLQKARNREPNITLRHGVEYAPLIQFVDYYYRSGKTYREHFTTHIMPRRGKTYWVIVRKGYYSGRLVEVLGEFPAPNKDSALKKSSELLRAYHKGRKRIYQKVDSPMKWQPWIKDLYGRFSSAIRTIESVLPQRLILNETGKWVQKPDLVDIRWDSYWEGFETLATETPTGKHVALVCISCGKITTEYRYVDADQCFCRCNECLFRQ